MRAKKKRDHSYMLEHKLVNQAALLIKRLA